MTVAVILAGGLGTRLRSVVSDVPKSMAPIRGRPFLEYQMAYWIAQGVEAFLLSVGYKKDIIIEHFGSSFKGVPVTYVVENQPLGTGGGLLLASQHLEQPFLLLNGDTFFEVSFMNLVKFHNLRSSEWTIALFKPSESERYAGVNLNNNGAIKSFDVSCADPDRLANGGVYLITPNVLRNSGYRPGQSFSLENDLVPKLLIDNKMVFGTECEGRFIDIGIPDDYHRASSILPKL